MGNAVKAGGRRSSVKDRTNYDQLIRPEAFGELCEVYDKLEYHHPAQIYSVLEGRTDTQGRREQCMHTLIKQYYPFIRVGSFFFNCCESSAVHCAVHCHSSTSFLFTFHDGNDDGDLRQQIPSKQCFGIPVSYSS
ncbi:unnamed protein product [Onchocerca flexuosa]|uniref:Transposase n=1 Tax=Onchocerca flexuosa TaxID=387005 RepID=A0A183HI67_9BILA|nr:unnamed protein product [Onchocerca flexuosa]